MQEGLRLDGPIAPGSFNDDEYDEDAVSTAQLQRYLNLMRTLDELRDVHGQTYVPVTYRGVRGIFVPESSISSEQATPGLGPHDFLLFFAI